MYSEEKMKKKNVYKLRSLFKKYEISENGRISNFSNVERLKVAYKILSTSININKLMKIKSIN